MKRNIVAFILCLHMVVLSACGKAEEEKTVSYVSLEEIRKEAENFTYECSNLDFSDTDIIIPEGDEIQDLVFPIDNRSYDEIKEEFYENIQTLTGKDAVDEQYVNCIFFVDNEEEGNRRIMPVTEVTEPEINKGYDSGGWMLSYNDGIYSSLLYSSSFMCEITDRTLWNEVNGDGSENSDSVYGYRIFGMGDLVKSFDLQEDDISDVSYRLSDGEVRLEDAVSYVESTLASGYHFVGSPYLDYEVFHVDVRRLTEDVFYYEMQVKAVYKGIAFSYEKSSVSYVADDGKNQCVATAHTVSMLSAEHMDYIWSCAHSYKTKEEGEVYTKFLSIRDAAEKVSRMVAGSAKMRVGSVELVYRTEFCCGKGEGRVLTVKCHPVYHFRVPGSGLSEYDMLYFDVDAVTGTVSDYGGLD